VKYLISAVVLVAFLVGAITGFLWERSRVQPCFDFAASGTVLPAVWRGNRIDGTCDVAVFFQGSARWIRVTEP
jgi:hypothetical protein